MTDREFRKYLNEKRPEAIRAEVLAEKKPPTSERRFHATKKKAKKA